MKMTILIILINLIKIIYFYYIFLIFISMLYFRPFYHYKNSNYFIITTLLTNTHHHHSNQHYPKHFPHHYHYIRYFAVTQPIKYARHKNSRRVFIMLALTWVISLVISSPIVFGANYTARRSQTKYLCTFYNSDFLIYSSMGSFYIPCFLMILLYGKIFKAIRSRARKNGVQKRPKIVHAGEITENVMNNRGAIGENRFGHQYVEKFEYIKR